MPDEQTKQEKKPFLDKVAAFMRDVMELVSQQELTVRFDSSTFLYNADWVEGALDEGESAEHQTFARKWLKKRESSGQYDTRDFNMAMLASLGYFERHIDERQAPAVGGRTMPVIKTIYYYPTPQAWDLLKRPRVTPNIFISYKRGVSSTFALLIEERLRRAGANPDNIFIDKDIRGGDNWETLLKEKVTQADHFVALVGEKTLASPHVQHEINWAFASDQIRIIPILHSGYSVQQMVAEHGELGKKLANKHIRVVTEEKAADYEEALNFILRSLGYST